MLDERDAAEVAANVHEQGIDFTEAATVFLGPLALTPLAAVPWRVASEVLPSR